MSVLFRRRITVPVCWTKACRVIQKLHCDSTSAFKSASNTKHVGASQMSTTFVGNGFRDTQYTAVGTWNFHCRLFFSDASLSENQSEGQPENKLDSEETVENIYHELQYNFMQKHVTAIKHAIKRATTFTTELEMISLVEMIQHLDKLYSKGNDTQKTHFANCSLTQNSLTFISHTVNKNIKEFPVAALIKLLNPLYNFKEMSVLFAAAANSELQNRVSGAKVNEAYTLLNILRQENAEQNPLYQKSVDVVNNHIRELSFSKDMINTLFLMYKNDYIKGVDTTSLELKIIDGAQFLDAKQLYQVLYLSAKRKKRTALVRSCCYFILNKEWNFSAQELSNLFFVCSSLRIHQKQFASKITDLLCSQFSLNVRINHILCLNIIKSCSFTHWNDAELLRHLTKVVLENKSEMSPENLALLPVSLAQLRFTEFDNAKLLEITDSLLLLKSSIPQLWLKLVSSLCMLQIAPEGLVQEVLETEFSMSLLEGIKSEPLYSQAATYRMLLSIWAYYILELGGPAGSTFPKVQEAVRNTRLMMGNPSPAQSSPSNTAVVLQVQDCLAKICMYGNCIKRDVINEFDYKADFELYVSKSGIPVILSESSSNKQVLVKVVNFKNMLFSRTQDPVPMGSVAMAIRHLERPNNSVIVITYSDWEKQDKQEDKLQYLQDLLKKAAE